MSSLCHLDVVSNVFCYSKFIHDKYNYPVALSAYIAGSVYYLSMVLSPFLGFVIVRYDSFLSISSSL